MKVQLLGGLSRVCNSAEESQASNLMVDGSNPSRRAVTRFITHNRKKNIMPSKNRVTLASLALMISAIGVRLDAIEGKKKTGGQPAKGTKKSQEPQRESGLPLTKYASNPITRRLKTSPYTVPFNVVDYSYVNDLPVVLKLGDVTIRKHLQCYVILNGEKGLYVFRSMMNPFLYTKDLKAPKKLSEFFNKKKNLQNYASGLRAISNFIDPETPTVFVTPARGDYYIYSNWK